MNKKIFFYIFLTPTLLTHVYISSFFGDDSSANVLIPTAAGATIGGIAGKGKGAGIGALAGLGLGLLSNSARSSSRRHGYYAHDYRGDYRAEAHACRQAFNSLERDYNTLNHNYNILFNTSKDLEYQLNQSHKNYNNLLQKFESGKQQCLSLKADLSTLQQNLEYQLDESQENYSNLLQKFEAGKQQYLDLKNDLSALQQNFEKGTQTNQKLHKALEEQKALNDQLKETIRIKESAIKK